VTPATVVWLYLAASAILAAWSMLRAPNVRPRSVRVALTCFAAGQLGPLLGLLVLPSVVRLTGGAQLALPLVVLPSFFVVWLTIGWLLWAILDGVGPPRGGHPVRKRTARSGA
jgi:hypothetical protein